MKNLETTQRQLHNCLKRLRKHLDRLIIFKKIKCKDSQEILLQEAFAIRHLVGRIFQECRLACRLCKEMNDKT